MSERAKRTAASEIMDLPPSRRLRSPEKTVARLIVYLIKEKTETATVSAKIEGADYGYNIEDERGVVRG